MLYAATDSGVYKFNPAPKPPTGFKISGDDCVPCQIDGILKYSPMACHPIPKWSTNIEPDVAGYEIYRSIDGGAFELVETPNSSTNSWRDGGITTDSRCSGGHMVWYKIRAKDSGGNYSEFTSTAPIAATTVPLGSATPQREHGQAPVEYDLWQNNPNPFNPTTTIQYDLISAVNVKLVLYDVLGRKVRTLVDGQQTAGRYSVKIDGNNLSSGIYFYRIQAGIFSAMKKMLLMK
ncbi:MAG: T9SS type A sorting domain-containing protein [Bacteroidota bacterium]